MFHLFTFIRCALFLLAFLSYGISATEKKPPPFENIESYTHSVNPDSMSAPSSSPTSPSRSIEEEVKQQGPDFLVIDFRSTEEKEEEKYSEMSSSADLDKDKNVINELNFLVERKKKMKRSKEEKEKRRKAAKKEKCLKHTICSVTACTCVCFIVMAIIEAV